LLLQKQTNKQTNNKQTLVEHTFLGGGNKTRKAGLYS